MLRLINFRIAVTEKRNLTELVEQKYPSLQGRVNRIHVVRRSVDARKKPHITFVYTLFLEVTGEAAIAGKLKGDKNIEIMSPAQPEPVRKGTRPMKHRPVVVGFGPAGMLAALYLAREGYRPIVLERGQDVDTRTKDVERFWEKGDFKAESNVQFGEGGAGTFSDGKLTTRVTHPRLHEIATYFVQFGAPPEILYKHKPHVGTDILRSMVKRLRQQIIDWGGEVRFGAKMTDLVLDAEGRLTGIQVTSADEKVTGADEYEAESILPANVVLAGVGHSARDTYAMLYERAVAMEAKPFAVGVRIEHPQELIDESQYGISPGELGLGAAEYSIVYHDKPTGRTAYTFCMCPGGQVVASASEPGHVVTNGMSLYARNSGIANSALVVTVGPEDFGTHPLAGIAFQRGWEEKAFLLGGSTYQAPAQTVGSFLAPEKPEYDGEKSFDLPQGSVTTYQPGVVGADLHECLPTFVTDVMSRALPYFGRRIKGFDRPDICMTGVETRTSSPLRIHRGEDNMSPSTAGFYPIGEGAGYAGGIMSAALDGAETAIKIMAQYAPPE